VGAIAACGGQSDDQQIRNVINQFTVNIGQGHYSAACPLSTGNAHKDCAAFAGPYGPDWSFCRDEATNGAQSQAGQACISLQLQARAVRSFTSLTVAKVVVSGSTATVTFNGSGGDVFNLAKSDGNWRITSAPPLGKPLSSLEPGGTPATPSTPTTP
jgi:hypothetical protein